MRSLILACGCLVVGGELTAQDARVPANLASIELDRSRACVGLLAGVGRVSTELEPLAEETQRLGLVGQAIAIEDQTFVDSLRIDDPLESQVRDWFLRDRALAERYVASQDANLAAERSAGRETIIAIVTQAMEEVQRQADVIFTENEQLLTDAGPCDGAIFVRSAILEACETEVGPICDEAALPASETRQFRFVDEPTSMWDVQEFRPWTAPTPLQPGPTGELDGARTIGFARIGNIVVSVAFTPMFRPLGDVTPEELAGYNQINAALGLQFSHPELTFAPALGIRAAIPRALDNESRYLIHFGPPESPDVVWTGEADTGNPLESTVALSPAHVGRLRTGETLSLTAVRQGPEQESIAAYVIELSNVNQTPAIEALLGYMQSQLSADLNVLIAPRG